MKYEWFVFDLDGTLTESDEGITKSARYALGKMGVSDPGDEVMRKFVGPPLLWSFQHLAGMDEAQAQTAVEYYRERFAVTGWKENKVYPGIAQLLRGIKKRGGHIALASGKPEKFCLLILDYFGLAPFFEKVSAVTLTDNNADKKKLILGALPENADLRKAVMVGDRVFDIEGAREAGVDSVAAGYGYGDMSEFTGAKGVARTVDELWDLLIGDKRDPGYFITFEGADGCGKTTQFEMTRDYLVRRGWDVKSSREPGGCPISEKIRGMVLGVENAGMTRECEALLYAAARAQHVRQVILPALSEGKLVLCDRYLDSSIAYQGYGRELTEALVRQINEPAICSLIPHITVYFAADEETSRFRREQNGAPDRIESEDGEFMARMRRGFEKIADSEPDRVRRVDAGRGIDEVFADTARLIDDFLK